MCSRFENYVANFQKKLKAIASVSKNKSNSMHRELMCLLFDVEKQAYFPLLIDLINGK